MSSLEERRKYQNERYRRIRSELVAGLGGKCELCGFTPPPEIKFRRQGLQFHHVNRRHIGGRNARAPRNHLAHIRREIAKGEIRLVCALCHWALNRVIVWKKKGVLEMAIAFAPV